MGSGPESRFIAAVHRKLHPCVYREKMHNAYRGGTPDVWYSGNSDDLWAEYKWIPELPKKAPIRVQKLLSALQLQWLERRYAEGRNIVVILGSPTGAWIYEHRAWENDLPLSDFHALALSKQQVADEIRRRTCLLAQSVT